MIENGWIPVAEALPQDDFPVIVAYLPGFHKSTKQNRPRSWSITVARFSGGEWRFIIPKQKTRLPSRIKFWQPSPTPPRRSLIESFRPKPREPQGERSDG